MANNYHIKIEKHLSRILTNPNAVRELIMDMKREAYYVEAEYKRQIPVNSGLARRLVQIKLTDKGFIVTTTATNRGFRYPIAVHEGTRVWAGWPVDSPSSGKIRHHETPTKGGIKPNRFADRTFDKTIPVVVKHFQNSLERIINTYES